MGEQDDKTSGSLFVEHIRAILNLSTGSLVLSATLLKVFIPEGGEGKLEALCLLKTSWLLFVVSISSAISYSYFFALSARSEFQRYLLILEGGSLVAHLAFFAGILCFLIFAWINI